MRLRRRRTPLLLLPFLLPHLAIAASDPSLKSKPGSVEQLASDPLPADAPIASVQPSLQVPKDIGTKDAPVDGLDGKPHAGPFVDSGASRKKPNTVEDIVTGDRSGAKQKDISFQYEGATEKEREAHKLMLMEAQGTVMDDPNREVPKEGTTGTEGGVSERDRLKKAQELGETAEYTKPETPKEVPPLPESEQSRISKEKTAQKDKEDEVADHGAPGFEKPNDLPKKPHDIPYPSPDGTQQGAPLSDPPVKTPSSTDPSSAPGEEQPEGIIQPFHSFVLSLTMILFSEIGDKTFLVAALMAMRHPRTLVFSAAFSALIAMTILSAVLGHAVPTLIPERFTHFAAAVLFLVFGAKMLREGYKMDPEEGVGEEMREVEMELEEKEHSLRKKSRRGSAITPYALEAGRGRRSRSDSRLPAPPRSPSSSPSPSSGRGVSSAMAGLSNLLGLLLSPAWVQTFIMTFLGEWGDRSQIATIAMAAGQDYWWVTGGAISGHAVCTGIAVIGGKAIAGRVSMRVVTLGGAYAFLVFGIIYLFEASYSD